MFIVIAGYEKYLNNKKGIIIIVFITILTFGVFLSFNLYHSLLTRFSLSY